MKKIVKIPLLLLFVLSVNYSTAQTPANNYDVVVYGGTSAGVIAAYSAKELGKSVLLIESGTQVGGVTSGGLGYADIGNKTAITGLSLDFFRKIGTYYGTLEQYIYEPHVALNTFNAYIQKANVPVMYNSRIISAAKTNSVITAITIENSVNPSTSTNQTISAKEFIDCSYEGDLMFRAAVSYTIGRESNSQYTETGNGVETFTGSHQFPDGIDPYITAGNPSSGLIYGVSNASLLPNGSADTLTQTYNIRICLSKDPTNSIPITQPADYQPSRYELLARLMNKTPFANIRSFLKIDSMPNNKTDINNSGPFSTDMIGANWSYPNGSYATRNAIFQAHVNYTKGLLYFIGHDSKIPDALRQQMLVYGYPKDEYISSGNFTSQLYVREARRMVSDYVMTQGNCVGTRKITDGVGMGSYRIDTHSPQRVVINGSVANEGEVAISGFGPYPIAYRSLVPKIAQCTNLIVPVCLSASHVAYASIRMEPVFMVLAQSAAYAACQAIDANVAVQNINVPKLQSDLLTNPLADGSFQQIIVDNDDSASVKYAGNWKRKTNYNSSYGTSIYYDNSPDRDRDSVTFTPNIPKAGNYNVYTFLVKGQIISKNIPINVNDGNKITSINLLTDGVTITGQSLGQWVPLGLYSLQAGKTASVTISAKNTSGIVVADAVLCVPAN